MARQHFTILHFVQDTDVDLLEAYFRQANIPFPDKLKLTGKDNKPNGQEIETYTNSLSPEIQKKVTKDFVDINDMAYEGAILSIIDVAGSVYKTPIQDELGKLSGYTNQALYCFLNHNEMFQTASRVAYLEHLSSKTIVHNLPTRPEREITGSTVTSALENELKLYFKQKDGRGQNCRVDIIPYKDKIFYHASPQDYSQLMFTYDDRNEYRREVVRPVFTVVFIYYPSDGKLELSANCRGKRKAELIDIFTRVVLKSDEPAVTEQQAYDFNKILSANFDMPIKLGDGLTWTYLKQLRLSYRYIPAKRITLEIDDKDTNGAKAIHQMIKDLGLNTDQLNVTQATFKLKFEGAGNKGGVAATITYPDKCNLSTTPTHQKAKDYLKYWGLEICDEAGAIQPS